MSDGVEDLSHFTLNVDFRLTNPTNPTFILPTLVIFPWIWKFLIHTVLTPDLNAEFTLFNLRIFKLFAAAKARISSQICHI